MANLTAEQQAKVAEVRERYAKMDTRNKALHATRLHGNAVRHFDDLIALSPDDKAELEAMKAKSAEIAGKAIKAADDLGQLRKSEVEQARAILEGKKKEVAEKQNSKKKKK